MDINGAYVRIYTVPGNELIYEGLSPVPAGVLDFGATYKAEAMQQIADELIRETPEPITFTTPRRPDGNLVLKWAWRYHVLEVEEYESLDSALRSAQSASDYGTEALDHIEVWENGNHRSLSADECWKLLEPIRRRESEEWAARIKDNPVVATVEIETIAKDGRPETARYESYTSMDEAKDDFEKLRPFLGSRVMLKHV